MRADIPRPNLLWRLFAGGGIATMGLLALSDPAWEWWEQNVTDSIPRPAMRQLFWGTVGIHIAEALYIRRKARRAGVEHSGAWGRTALLYGFPTMGALRRHVRELDAGLDHVDAALEGSGERLDAA